MPVISGSEAPVFQLESVSFTGLAAPSRGSKETSAWRVELAADTPANEHTLDREEILIAIRGKAVASLANVDHEVVAGDAIIVPAGELFSLANPYPEPFEAVAILPVGGQGCFPGGEPFTPPWTI